MVLTGGGFDYPDIPVLFAGPTGGSTVTVFGVQGADDFFTVDEFNTTYAKTKVTIHGAPPDPNSLAVLPAFDPSADAQITLAGRPATAVTGFAPLTLIPAPQRDYHSPYALTGADPDQIADYAEAPRADPADWIAPGGEGAEYGPEAIDFAVSAGVAALTPLEQAKRLVSAAQLLLGETVYSHFHVPSWLPPLDHNWQVAQVAMRVLPGIDCSDFTSFLYNFALGIELHTGVGQQATQASAVQRLADGTTRALAIERHAVDPGTTPAEVAKTYEDLRAVLRPGDLLYIAGTGPETDTGTSGGSPTAADAKHVIMWLGELGQSADGLPLVVDSTGPEHIDAAGYHPPAGVHVRPFAPQGVNSWYAHDIVGWSRVIPSSDQ